MPTNGRWAADTSVAVAALDRAHAAHEVCRAAVRELRPVLAGHSAFETFSVLTRMPGSQSVTPADAAYLINTVFGTPCWLSDMQISELFGRLRTLGLRGGAVYDALVGEAARANDHRLLTRDLRARRTYDLLGVNLHLI